MVGKSILAVVVCSTLGFLAVYAFGLPSKEIDTQPLPIVETVPEVIKITNMQDRQEENDTAKTRAVTLATQVLKERGLDTRTVPGGSQQSITLIDAEPWRDNSNIWQVRFDFSHTTDSSVKVTVNIATEEVITVDQHVE